LSEGERRYSVAEAPHPGKRDRRSPDPGWSHAPPTRPRPGDSVVHGAVEADTTVVALAAIARGAVRGRSTGIRATQPLDAERPLGAGRVVSAGVDAGAALVGATKPKLARFIDIAVLDRAASEYRAEAAVAEHAVPAVVVVTAEGDEAQSSPSSHVAKTAAPRTTALTATDLAFGLGQLSTWPALRRPSDLTAIRV